MTSNSKSCSSIPFCSELEKYNDLKFIGCGSFGKVYCGKDSENNNNLVAIKCVPLNSHEGVPISIIRELNHLKQLKHDNIVGLRDVCLSNDMSTVFIILDYYPHDLSGIINYRDIVFDESFTKSLMKQLLEGVAYIHDNQSIHCDLKTSNLFLDGEGKLKIGDFNLSRFNDKLYQNKFMSRNVVTLWYRAPELLLSDKDYMNYGSEVDMWACGCILAELLLRQPLFCGADEQSQLGCIFGLFGNQNMFDSGYPHKFKKFQKLFNGRFIPDTFFFKFREFNEYRPQVVDLLRKMLEVNPSKRISAKEALNHGWFNIDPQPDRRSVILPSAEVSINENWIREQIRMKQKHEAGRQQKRNCVSLTSTASSNLKKLTTSNQELKRKRFTASTSTINSTTTTTTTTTTINTTNKSKSSSFIQDASNFPSTIQQRLLTSKKHKCH